LIAAWYGNIFGRDLNDLGIIYSPLHYCFFTRPNFTPSSNLASVFVPDFQRYTDRNELNALVSLIGPAGVRIIFATLMKIAAVKLKALKEILSSNASIARSITNRFNDTAALGDAIANCSNMDTLVQLTTAIGAALHFRALLTAALSRVIQTATPYIAATLSLGSDIAHERTRCDHSLTVLDLLAADCGKELHEADHLFRHLLSKLKTTVADVSILSALPEIYALSLSSSRWRSAQYVIDYQGYTNNAHCQAIALRHLLVDWNRVSVGGIKEAEADINNRIQLDYERYLAYSTAVLTHLYIPATNITILLYNQNNSMNLTNIRAIGVGSEPITVVNSKIGVEVGGISGLLIWLEQVVEQSDGRLTLGTLDKYLPYGLLRENYSQMDEKQNPQTANYAALADEEKE